MARGNNTNIPSNTGVLLPTQFGERQTLLVLNPNNGVLYVKINSTADPITWDWVVPSQSRAYLPGPWLECGLFYVDQSGAGATGNVTVYETDQKLDVPDYAAIGVARLALQSSMDITEGTLPPNPGAGILREWADGTNKLHLLGPSGADKTVIDTGTALGGSLTGTLPNPGIATLSGALSGSVLPQTFLQYPESLLPANVALTAATFHLLLFSSALNPIGSVWKVGWKVIVAANVAVGVVVAGGLFNPAGAVLDISSGNTYGPNYGGGAPEITLSGEGLYTVTAVNDQLSIRVYHSHAGGVALVRTTAVGSGTGTWIRGLRVF